MWAGQLAAMSAVKTEKLAAVSQDGEMVENSVHYSAAMTDGSWADGWVDEMASL